MKTDLDKTLEAKVVQLREQLAAIAADYAPAALANSFGAEDMVLTDAIAGSGAAIEIFSLDTGRLPAETYDLMQEAMRRYGLPIQVYFPDRTAVQDYVTQHGPNAFYDSVELRKRCCHIRKVEPLQRALRGKKAWITGLRREQSATRVELPLSEWDEANRMQKFNPLRDWTTKDVWAYIRHFGVPYNKLHDKFYPSIGCAPCTRAIAVGEDLRAGRWWWEQPESKECGLHIKKAAAG